MAKVAGLTDSRGNLPLARQNMAYLADALAMMAGGWLKNDLGSRDVYRVSVNGAQAIGSKT